MPSNRLEARLIARLAIVLLASSALAAVAPAHAGPISEMLAKHRQARQMKLPPMDKPHTLKPYKDPNARTAGLTQRFKQRFSLKNGKASQDQGVIKTSR